MRIQSTNTQRERALEMLSAAPMLRASDLRQAGVSPWVLDRLVKDEEIENIGFGTFRHKDWSRNRDITWTSFAVLAFRHPSAVICLVSAAAFYGLTTANPPEVWAAFPYTSSIPKADDPAVKGFRWKPVSMQTDIVEHELCGIKVNMTSPARTVVDLVRSMNRTGEAEVAMESLNSYFEKGYRPDDLSHIAEAMNVSDVLRPYLQTASAFRP